MKKRIYIILFVLTAVACSKDEEPLNIAPEIKGQSFSISEGANDTDIFGKVTATDKNTDDKLTFSIVTNDNGLFEIAPTGDLSLAAGKSLDFETATSHAITVQVSDGALQASAEMTIAVTDVDENNPPVFDQTAYTFTVSENIVHTTTIGTVSATDQDGDALSYELNSFTDIFEINQQTGVIILKVGLNLDFETKTTYSLDIGVNDGTSSATNLPTVTVDVKDEATSITTFQLTGSAKNLSNPISMAVDDAGNFYLSDFGNHQIKKITPTGEVTVLAGTGSGSNDGTGSAAQFNHPGGITIDRSTNDIYVADFSNARIRKITSDGAVTTVAGSSTGFVEGTGTAAKFSGPLDIAISSAGILFVVDSGNDRIRRVDPVTGEVTTFAGSSAGFQDGDGVSTAMFTTPRGITIDDNDNLYVSDGNNHAIRKVTPSGNVSTLAGGGTSIGSGVAGFSDGSGSAARFQSPLGLTVDGMGNVYVADELNHRIRKVTPAGVVTTVAGSTQGYQDGFATSAKFNGCGDIVMIDGSSNLYVIDRKNNSIREIYL